MGMATMDETTARLNTHEEVCAMRYEKIELQFEASNARLKRIETILTQQGMAEQAALES